MMTEQERIREIATNFVCPNTHQTSTVYERGFVKTLISFAHILIQEAGYRLPAGKAPLLADKEIAQLPKYAVTIGNSEPSVGDWRFKLQDVLKAQRDADHKFYTGGKE